MCFARYLFCSICVFADHSVALFTVCFSSIRSFNTVFLFSMTSYYKWHTEVMEKRKIFLCSIAGSQCQLESGEGGNEEGSSVNPGRCQAPGHQGHHPPRAWGHKPRTGSRATVGGPPPGTWWRTRPLPTPSASMHLFFPRLAVKHTCLSVC